MGLGVLPPIVSKPAPLPDMVLNLMFSALTVKRGVNDFGVLTSKVVNSPYQGYGAALKGNTVVVGAGQGNVATSTDRGATWQPYLAASSQYYTSFVGVVGDLFVAVCTDYTTNYLTKIATSPDGVTWNSKYTGTATWQPMAFDSSGLYGIVQMLNTATYGMTDNGGVTWTGIIPTGATTATGAVSIGSPKSVIIEGTKVLICDTVNIKYNTGSSWATSYTLPSNGVSTANNATVWVIGGYAGNISNSKNNGGSWANHTVGDPTGTWSGVHSCGNGVWIAGSGKSQIAVSRDDGDTWTVNTVATGNFSYLAHVDNKYIAISSTTPAIMVSTDSGATWKQIPPLTNGNNSNFSGVTLI